jgi:hypothetical protein
VVKGFDGHTAFLARRIIEDQAEVALKNIHLGQCTHRAGRLRRDGAALYSFSACTADS